MKKLTSLFAILALLGTGLVACEEEGEPEDLDRDIHAETMEEMDEISEDEAADDVAEEAAQPEMVDGVQVITVRVEDEGYTPSRIAFQEGIPAKIIFDQHGTTACAWDVMSKDLGIKLTELPEGEQTAVEFTPEKEGTYTFTCGMDMMKGTVVVEA